MAEVKVYVYDLSRGMAKSMSMMFLGKQIDAIYHTSVVVFDREYYFGQGIESCSILTATSTHYFGVPLEIIDMVTKEIFDEHIDGLRVVFTAEKYHLLDNNCNNFTDELCQFLVGKSLPAYITGLPEHFESTPLGRQLRPLIDGMFAQARSTHLLEKREEAQRAANMSFNSLAISTQTFIEKVGSEQRFEEIVRNHNAVVVAFAGQDYDMASFERIFKDLRVIPRGASGAGGDGLKAIFVDVESCPKVAELFKISSALPAFITFAHSKQVESVKGANDQQMTSLIRNLMLKVYPKHKHHTKLQLKTPLQYEFIKFSSYNSNSIFERAKLCLKGDAEALKKLSILEQCVKASSNSLSKNTLIDFFRTHLLENPLNEHSFALMDLFRVLIQDQLIKDDFMPFLQSCLNRFCVAKTAEINNVPILLAIVTFRLVASMIPGKSWPLLTEVISSHLLGTNENYSEKFMNDDKCRQAIASLLFNIGLSHSLNRQHLRCLNNSAEGKADDDLALECVSGLGYFLCFTNARKDDTTKTFLRALFHFIYFSVDENIYEICKALELMKYLTKMINDDPTSPLADLSRDIKEMLQTMEND